MAQPEAGQLMKTEVTLAARVRAAGRICKPVNRHMLVVVMMPLFRQAVCLHRLVWIEINTTTTVCMQASTQALTVCMQASTQALTVCMQAETRL